MPLLYYTARRIATRFENFVILTIPKFLLLFCAFSTKFTNRAPLFAHSYQENAAKT